MCGSGLSATSEEMMMMRPEFRLNIGFRYYRRGSGMNTRVCSRREKEKMRNLTRESNGGHDVDLEVLLPLVIGDLEEVLNVIEAHVVHEHLDG